MVVDSGSMAKKALMVAIRYAAIRRQFGQQKGTTLESKILDYPIHQYRLMPLLAQAFAMHFTGVEVLAIYDDLMEKLESVSSDDDAKATNALLEQLKEVHGTSAGLKAFCTWNCLNTIDQCRQACGGHGYSAYTGLASMYSDFAVQCTWEGDNTILTLQAGRYLIGCYREAKGGKAQAGGVAYLNNLTALISSKCSATQPAQVLELDVIGKAFNVVSGNVVKKAGEDFEECLKRGLREDEAYEECSQARLFAAKMHSYGYLFHRFNDALAKTPTALKPILSNLCRLYGLYNIVENSGAFLQYGFFDSKQMDWIRAHVSDLCRIIRADAIPLTDSFAYSDYIINSPLGAFNGDIYEQYFNLVKTAHPPAQVPTYFEREISPLLNKKAEAEEEDVLELDDEDDE
jgi:acyl-CoA oxidase